MTGLRSFDKKEDDYKDLERSVNIDEAMATVFVLWCMVNVLPTPKLVKGHAGIKKTESSSPLRQVMEWCTRITSADVIDRYK